MEKKACSSFSRFPSCTPAKIRQALVMPMPSSCMSSSGSACSKRARGKSLRNSSDANSNALFFRVPEPIRIAHSSSSDRAATPQRSIFSMGRSSLGISLMPKKKDSSFCSIAFSAMGWFISAFSGLISLFVLLFFSWICVFIKSPFAKCTGSLSKWRNQSVRG